MACNRLRFFIIVLIFLGTNIRCAMAGLIGSGPLFVGITPVELSRDKTANEKSLLLRPETERSELVASIVQDLLPTYIQRGLEKGFDRRVLTKEINSPQFSTDTDSQALSAIVSPSVINMGLFGVRVSATILMRPESLGQGPTDHVISRSELLLLSPDTDFRELDEKLLDFGVRIAKNLIELSAINAPSAKLGLPRGIVGFYCVSSLEPDDRALQQLGRLLTIELPYYLTQASKSRGLDLTIRGLDLREAIGTCEQPRSSANMQSTNSAISYSEARIENFSWTGTVSHDPKHLSRVQLTVRAIDRLRGGNLYPLVDITITDPAKPLLPIIADQIVKSFVESRLEEAIAAYRETLQELTRARMPRDWAKTQMNLGIALAMLGERESGTAWLEEAVAAYREALQELTRARVPLDWAKSTGNQGVALMLLAERRGDAEIAKRAVQQIEAAFTTSRDGGDASSAADFEAELPKARGLVDQLSKR